jgi:CheY-like chemotaxis protein
MGAVRRATTVLESASSDGRIPLLVVTALADRQSTRAVLAAGADRRLPKPVTAESLREALMELLGPQEEAEPEGGGITAVRILVVDDDEETRKRTAGILQEEGHETETAANGSAGVTRCADWHPDLVLMDLAMPKLDGWNARRLLERSRNTAGIPVILMDHSSEDRERARIEGFVDLLRKPFTREELIETVDDALRFAGFPREKWAESAQRPPSVPALALS